jgi:hypothetical protein
LNTLAAVRLEAAEDHREERLRRVGALQAERDGGLGGDGHEHGRRGVALEWRRAGDELVEDDAERPEVGAQIDGVRAQRLLGRHVLGRAEDGVREREQARL